MLYSQDQSASGSIVTCVVAELISEVVTAHFALRSFSLVFSQYTGDCAAVARKPPAVCSAAQEPYADKRMRSNISKLFTLNEEHSRHV